MSSPYLTILTKKLAAHNDVMRHYYDRVIHNVETLKAFRDRENMAHIILAHSLSDMPEELCQYIPEQAFTTHLARYIYEEADRLNRLLFSTEFIVDPATTAKSIADGFTAKVAEDMLQQYAMGGIETDEPEIYNFKWPFYSETDFPYEDQSSEESAQEAEILDRLEATLAKIQDAKNKN